MSSIGTGYDLSASQFSPDGRVFQVEYALKAVENSGTAVGLRGKDGVVLAVEKLVTSKLYEHGANKRIFNIDKHIGMCIAGLIADARAVVEIARDEAVDYRNRFRAPVPLKYLVDRVSSYVHAYTLYSAVRPFGVSIILCSYTETDGPSMYNIEPSGVAHGYYGAAVGKAKQGAKTEIEKLKLSELTCEELIKEAAKIIYTVHDEVKDKQFELELSWVSKDSNGVHQFVPEEKFTAAEQFAKDALVDSDSDGEDM